MKNPKQLDLFSKIPTWKKRGFKSEDEYKKALEFDRAWRHMEQSNLSRLKKSMIHKRKTNLFMAIGRKIRELLK